MYNLFVVFCVLHHTLITHVSTAQLVYPDCKAKCEQQANECLKYSPLLLFAIPLICVIYGEVCKSKC
ncbi:hypothetical protein CRM22_008937 [Opisthorchis felineus]|uniref:FZ domain-containing protein n=1 Tax=Opisthorchis felineus TaxID=147828 RepID=A0A4S2LH36_OPIFE|nr:hypothetical protein CRM22_008937 [Opisthorchis felineus]TGZ59688.1 hypothetical protein CRM22_008937 [Opisthorchis felineus]TGZ59689.1 hypothetical protein CRM22_008937 [Opisthorchis felineus]